MVKKLKLQERRQLSHPGVVAPRVARYVFFGGQKE